MTTKEYQHNWYLKNKDKVKDQTAKWQKDNNKKCRGYAKKYREKYPEKTKMATTKYRLRTQYGMTIDDYNKMFEEQNGCCFLCGRHQSELTSALHVDHDHKTGRVRKLLCKLCNVRVGWFENHSIDKYLKE